MIGMKGVKLISELQLSALDTLSLVELFGTMAPKPLK